MLVYITLAVISILASISSISAQVPTPSWYIGPYGSIMQSYHSTDFRDLPGYPSCCIDNRSGSGLGYDIGMLFHVPMKQYGMRIFAGINNPSATIFTDEKIGNQFIRNVQPPFDTIARDVIVRHEIDAQITAVSLRPMFTHALPIGGDLMAGFGLNYILTNTFSQREKLIAPDNVAFIDGRGVRNESSGTIPNTSYFQTSFIIGYSYNFPISNSSVLMPFIEYHYPLQSLTSYSWNIQKLQLGMSINFGIIPSKEPMIRIDTMFQRDTVYKTSPIISLDSIYLFDRRTRFSKGIEQHGLRVDTLVISETFEFIKATPSTLNGGIMAMGMDMNGNFIGKPIIRIEEWEQIETFPLLPYVYFDEASSDLGGTDQHLLLPAKTAKFHEDSLASSTLEIYRDMLNVIGKRAKETNVNIKITGHINETPQETSNELAKSRAEVVKEYFVNTWGINPDRLSIKYGGLPPFPSNSNSIEGQHENSRAEIASKDFTIMAPLKKRTFIKTMNPPIVVLKPTIDDSTSIRSWSITIDDAGETVFSTTGIGNLPDSMLKWQIRPSNNMEDKPLNVRFTAVDTLGKPHQWTTSLSTERITLKKKQELRINDTLIERFALILFDFNKSSLSPTNQQIAKLIQESIKDNSKVTITGHTDLIGNIDYNTSLSQSRCEEVQRFLQIPDKKVRINPLGGKTFPFSNDSPQGRAYSRTVFVEIRTPISSTEK